MKNKVKALISIIVLLLIGIYLILNIGNKYENIRIISEDPSCGSPSRIIYNDKVYEISEENGISSIKYYNGKIYFYKSIGKVDIFSYTQAVNELKNIDSIFYEFGEIILDEEKLTYSMKVKKQISYKEYENGDKSKIEYSVKNLNGEYGLEIFELIETIEDITILKKYSGTEYYIEFTKKDENNNIIWKYNTNSTVESQYDVVGILEITADRLYINDEETIVALDRENGKIIWKSDACKKTEGAIDSSYLDEKGNLYIHRGSLTVIDKNGKIIATITDDILSGDGVGFYPINTNELLLSGMNGYLVINLEKFNIEYKIAEESKDVENENEYSVIYTKKDKDNNTIWAYETQKVHNTELNTVEFLSIVGNNIYINESGIITALDIKTGKMIWQNTEYKGASSSFCVDENNNLYISGYYEPFLHIIDENGKTIKRIDPFDDNFKGPGDIYLRNNNELVINCSINAEEIRAVVNLKDYSITYENIEE